MKLPGSGLAVSDSIKYFLLLPGEDPPAFMPDRLQPFSSADYFSAHDPVLGSVLPRLARRRPARP